MISRRAFWIGRVPQPAEETEAALHPLEWASRGFPLSIASAMPARHRPSPGTAIMERASVALWRRLRGRTPPRLNAAGRPQASTARATGRPSTAPTARCRRATRRTARHATRATSPTRPATRASSAAARAGPQTPPATGATLSAMLASSPPRTTRAAWRRRPRKPLSSVTGWPPSCQPYTRAAIGRPAAWWAAAASAASADFSLPPLSPRPLPSPALSAGFRTPALSHSLALFSRIPAKREPCLCPSPSPSFLESRPNASLVCVASLAPAGGASHGCAGVLRLLGPTLRLTVAAGGRDGSAPGGVSAWLVSIDEARASCSAQRKCQVSNQRFLSY